MKITAIGNFCLPKNKSLHKNLNQKNNSHPTFKANDTDYIYQTRYYKKYNTLPSEIKCVLKPNEATDMFREMEQVAQGKAKGEVIGFGSNSAIYENPWLNEYSFIVVKDGNDITQTIYSARNFGNSVWSDTDDNRIHIIKDSA